MQSSIKIFDSTLRDGEQSVRRLENVSFVDDVEFSVEDASRSKIFFLLM